jgi:hypothetical protein
MIVDCMTCPVRGRRCDDCTVTALSGSRAVEHLASPELRFAERTSSEVTLNLEGAATPGLPLDAAEHTVVSIFVGAGLVNAWTATRLCARRESSQHWALAREVG